MRTAPSPLRAAWAVVLALVLALRLAVPTGFMPAVEHGRLTIVDCPGGDMPMPPMSAIGHDPKSRQSCPFADATGAGLVDVPAPVPVVAVVEPVALNGTGDAEFALPRGQHDRPPAIGPPLPA